METAEHVSLKCSALTLSIGGDNPDVEDVGDVCNVLSKREWKEPEIDPRIHLIELPFKNLKRSTTRRELP